MKYADITIEREIGRTYAKNTYAVYGHSLKGSRCWIKGGFVTSSEALTFAKETYPSTYSEVWAGSSLGM